MADEHGNYGGDGTPPKLETSPAETNDGDKKHGSKRKTNTANTEHHKSLRRSWRAASPITKLEVAFAGVIAAATLAYCIFSGWQLSEMKKATEANTVAARAASANSEIAYWALMGNQESSIFTLDQMASQSASQKASAKAAKTATDNARSYFRNDQRPYLFPEPRGVFGTTDKPNEYAISKPLDNKQGVEAGISVEVTNTGRSPAIDIVASVTQYFIGPALTVTEQARNFKPDYTKIAASTLGIQAKLTAPSNAVTLDNDVVSSLTDGGWLFYAVGGVQYRDMFSPRIEPYETTYCYLISTTHMAFHNCSFGKGHFGNGMK
jgi:hypothetical protein